jgi:hypothetical protein
MASTSNQFTLRNAVPAYAMAALPIISVPIQDVQLFDYAVAHKSVNASYGLQANNDDTYVIGNDPYTSDQQRSRDQYEINDTDWNEVTFEQIDGTSKCKLALNYYWIEKNNYSVDAIVNMNLPEQGISGPFKITSIKHITPQKKPVDEDEADDYEYRPVTGLFVHQSNEVWKIKFDNGTELGVTNNHPIYSVSKGDWQHAGHLEIGEEVLAKGGNTKVASKERDLTVQPVYNLEVKDLHNFLVGDVGVVVHNLCNKALIKKYIDEVGDLADLPDGPQKSALLKLKSMKDLKDPDYDKFLNDFADNVPIHLGESGIKAWEKLLKQSSSVSDILRKDIRTLEWFSKHGDNIPKSAADDLLASIDKPIKETIEDAQGRLTYVLDRPGQSNKVVSVHPTSSGQFKTTSYSPAYNPDLNPSISVPLSANKLTPDYINTGYMHPLQGNTVVKIELSGDRAADFARSRAALGITQTQENAAVYVWHHMDDFEIINGKAYGTMQLVERSAHNGTGVMGMQHSGSAAQWRAYFGSGY